MKQRNIGKVGEKDKIDTLKIKSPTKIRSSPALLLQYGRNVNNKRF